MTKDKQPSRQRPGTATRAFGAGERRSHDFSSYYARRINQAQPMARERLHYHENPMPLYLTNKAFEHPFIARDQLQPGQQNQQKPQLPDHSVHLLATSLGSELPAAGLEAWLNTPEMTWTEALRVLTPGGRMCVTLANPGLKPYVPLHALVTSQCQELGILMRGEIILQLKHEETRVGHRYILVWSKEGYRRPRTMGWSSTVSGPEFIRASKSIWPLATMIDAHCRTIELYT